MRIFFKQKEDSDNYVSGDKPEILITIIKLACFCYQKLFTNISNFAQSKMQVNLTTKFLRQLQLKNVA